MLVSEMDYYWPVIQLESIAGTPGGWWSSQVTCYKFFDGVGLRSNSGCCDQALLLKIICGQLVQATRGCLDWFQFYGAVFQAERILLVKELTQVRTDQLDDQRDRRVDWGLAGNGAIVLKACCCNWWGRLWSAWIFLGEWDCDSDCFSNLGLAV